MFETETTNTTSVGGKILASNSDSQLRRCIAGFICMMASLAYLTMATGHGYITRCCDGRSFYYARYIDWMFTTPLMLYELHTLFETGAVHFRLFNSYSEFLWIFFMDILMIASGLIGSLVCGSEKWVFWGFSVLTFIPILYQLCSWDDSLSESATYKKAMNITVVTWFFYPIVWIFAEGTGDLSSNGEAIAYTVDTKSHSARHMEFSGNCLDISPTTGN